MPPSAAAFSLRRKYRLLTRSDFDGLVCAALLSQRGIVRELQFVHPRDVQDGTVELSRDDITAKLPYRPEVALALDHHSSEVERVGSRPSNWVMVPEVTSTARVVYEHFGGVTRFPVIGPGLLEALDRVEADRLTLDDILRPRGWTLLSFLVDPRTGLGRFHDFRISNYDLMVQLVGLLQTHNVEEILASPDVAERIALYRRSDDDAAVQLLRRSRTRGRLAVVDLRGEEVIHPTNRYLLGGLHPECTVLMHLLRGREDRNTSIAVGRSVINRGSQLDLGSLMVDYGGGGTERAATCQVPNDRADAVIAEITRTILHAEELALTARGAQSLTAYA